MEYTNSFEEPFDSRDNRPERAVAPKVLLCLDRSELSETLLSYAVMLTRALSGSLTLMHVVEPSYEAPSSSHDVFMWRLKHREAHQYMEQVLERTSGLEVPATLQIGEGRAAEQILGFIRQNLVDFVILASHGTHGLAEWSLSSTTAKIVGRAHSSFIIVPAALIAQHAKLKPSIQRILVPLDGSLASQACLPIAIRIARQQDAELILLHAIEPVGFYQLPGISDADRKVLDAAASILESVARKHFDQIAARLQNEGLRVTVEVRSGSNPTTLMSEIISSMDVDFIAMTAHGSSGSEEYPLARTSAHMVSHTPVPLLIVQDLEMEKVTRALRKRHNDRALLRSSKSAEDNTG